QFGGANYCAYSYFCAYHSDFTDDGGNDYIYSNMPFAATPQCDLGNHPNGDGADATINVTSHEHNEAITDPLGNAWWHDSTGNENGDNCAWDFGSSIGSTPNGTFNQLINGHVYSVQGEWSNNGSTCDWTYPAVAGPTNTALPAI